MILTALRAGAFLSVAAGSAGVSPRAVRDWIARGEGRHPTRKPTPQLIEFAKDVRKAQAHARLGAETRVYRDNPTYWLSHAARTTPEEEGWTQPRAGEDEGGIPAALAHLSQQEFDEQIQRFVYAALRSGALSIPPCSHPRCRCDYHKPRRQQ